MKDYDIFVHDICPVPAPRMTQRDKWVKRPCVVRYHAFKDLVREWGVTVEDGDRIFFMLPMPKSWSKRKKAEMKGMPHRQKPDIDNLCKALFDAIFADDCHIASIQLYKHWHDKGQIIIHRRKLT